ncbi:hypothetical protein GOP47_0019757 [Adiantum capillus-veneris]|uniref:Large ribosomal subunit protein uL15/eL18 domain-containing protein n=1 Tax=Adiantum capillus-veneris TaxID=13818 RepID=A0A9D4Z8X4_ADICA|nr:hypothetical protein GOP47_0019757 [Adiantum capillus-veneris]
MGINFPTRARNKKTKHTSPRSDNVYWKLIVKLYRFLVRRTGSPFNAVFLNRLFMSRTCPNWLKYCTSERSKYACEAVKHFGRSRGVPHSHTKPYVRSKGCKFERARGRRNIKGYRV